VSRNPLEKKKTTEGRKDRGGRQKDKESFLKKRAEGMEKDRAASDGRIKHLQEASKGLIQNSR